MPNQGELQGFQFLPETRTKIDIKVPGENKLLGFGVTLFILSILVAGGLYYYKDSLETKITDLNGQITALENQRDKKAEAAIITYNKQAKVISQMLDSHIFWTKAFSKLESLTNGQVIINGLTGTTDDGKISFQAFAPSYTIVARQVASFTSDDSIVDINIGEIKSSTDGKLEFGITLLVDKSKFFTNTTIK